MGPKKGCRGSLRNFQIFDTYGGEVIRSLTRKVGGKKYRLYILTYLWSALDMVVYFQTLTSPIRIEKLGKECEQGYILKIFDIKSTKSYNSQSSDDTFSTDCWMRSPSPERQNEIARLEMNKCRSKRFLGSFMRLGSIFCHFGQQHSSKKTKNKNN